MGGFMAALPAIGKAVGMGAASAVGGQAASAGMNAMMGPGVQNFAGQMGDPQQQTAARQQLLQALMQQMQQQQRGPQATQMESRTMTPMPDIHSLIAALSQRRV